MLPDDDEVLQDERTDEMAAYFSRQITPKVLLTSFTRASQVCILTYQLLTYLHSLFTFLFKLLENQLATQGTLHLYTKL